MKHYLALIGLSVVLTGCQQALQNSDDPNSELTEPAPHIVTDASLTDSERAKLLSAKELLFKTLSGRLMDALSAKGPAGAIEVCSTEAQALAVQVGQQAHVRIGRTGVRLRNTNNQPPSWAIDLVAAKTESPVFARLSNQQAVALLPIKLQPQCLMCHGPQEQLAPDVIEQLSKLYPQDRATGFAEGELRGWFWVESID